MKQFLFLVLGIYLVGIIFYLAIFYYQLKPLPVEAGLQNQTVQFIVQKGIVLKKSPNDLKNRGLFVLQKVLKSIS